MNRFIGPLVLLLVVAIVGLIVVILATTNHNSDRADLCEKNGGVLVQRAPVGSTVCVSRDAVVPMR